VRAGCQINWESGELQRRSASLWSALSCGPSKAKAVDPLTHLFLLAHVRGSFVKDSARERRQQRHASQESACNNVLPKGRGNENIHVHDNFRAVSGIFLF
jgi:hypothetical protein